jgi:hypothetical protein
MGRLPSAQNYFVLTARAHDVLTTIRTAAVITAVFPPYIALRVLQFCSTVPANCLLHCLRGFANYFDHVALPVYRLSICSM